MTSRHLPAGQNIPPAQGGGGPHVQVVGGMPPPVDMPGGPPVGSPASAHHGGQGHGPGHGHHHNHNNHNNHNNSHNHGHNHNHHHGHGHNQSHRRRQPPPPHHPPQPNPYAPQYHPQHMNPSMYPNYVPYPPQQYYHGGMMPQYQQNMYPGPAMPYQNYPRSPPTMHQYAPMVGVTVQPSFPRHSQQSPALSTPYQPPVSVPMPPQTPSSTHSSQMIPPPTPPTPQQIQDSVPPAQSTREPSPEPVTTTRLPFRAPLPWLSHPDESWPARKSKPRRRRRFPDDDSQAVSLPIEQHEAASGQSAQTGASAAAASTPKPQPQSLASNKSSEPEAATASPTHSQPAQVDRAAGNTLTKAATRGTPVGVPLPAIPQQASRPSTAEKPQPALNSAQDDKSVDKQPENGSATVTESPEINAQAVATEEPTAPKPAPTSWANLFAKASAAGKPAVNGTSPDSATVNGDGTTAPNGVVGVAGLAKSNSDSIAEAIQTYKVGSEDHVSFIEPRGLINTGNMCYMNSILQVLMFCSPFYDFLDRISKRAAHSFKSQTPLLDAMIMFMHEFKVLNSTASVDQLRKSLKADDLEKFGEPFTPEFVYEAIRLLSRFASMRRGHQQDAEEFLGFLLQSLDDECTLVMSNSSISAEGLTSEVSSNDGHADASGDWLEVGRKQKAAVSRSSGSSASTPINKIFGGLLRSEFRVPGLKDSITTEPYQPLQLDIGSPDVRSVTDALRGLTRPERLQGDFNSPHGKDVTATKQVFIESLPPVLILHLKRFQFDAEGHGTVKIWKKIDYPLELEIPRDALSRQKRQTVSDGSMPKYKLISVVYHHGKNASGGHYTVDVRRQDGQDWLRLDDTVLRRVRSEDVAEVGSAEEATDNRAKNGSAATGTSANRFGAMNEEETGDEDGWKQVPTSSAGGSKRWSNVVNGTGSTAKGKHVKESVKDNKVAYLLFYQRM